MDQMFGSEKTTVYLALSPGPTHKATVYLASSPGPTHKTTVCLASSPGPTHKIRKGAWCHLQKFSYVLSQQIKKQLHALRDHVVASYC